MRFAVIISILFSPVLIHAQADSVPPVAGESMKLVRIMDPIQLPSSIFTFPVNDVNRIRVSINGADLNSNLHTSVFPLEFNDLSFTGQLRLANPHYSPVDRIVPHLNRRNFSSYLLPATDIGFGSQISPNGSISDIGYGAAVGVSVKNKISLQGTFIYTTSTLPAYTDSLRKQIDYVPGAGYYSASGKQVKYAQWIGSLSYKPNQYFRLEAGYGKNFLGEGYRSIFLSDNASPYPYGKITTRIWKIKYTNLYMLLSDKRDKDGYSTQSTNTKYTSIHHLSWNVSKRLNLQFFESIVWQSKDTLHNRQFDLHYLNPVIFYRPVEYGLGSSDNAVIGAGFKVKITNWVSIYGNAIIDEFLLSQIKADSGWWANKYAWQAGIKITEPAKIKNLFFQAEYTMARPFTWSHGTVLQNYGHMNQPLAHPLGSNFTETAFIAQYEYRRFYVNETVLLYMHGADSSVANFGGDIYRSYRDRYQDYHNYLGQGLKQNVFVHRFTLGWEIHPASALRLEFTHIYRQEKIPGNTFTHHYFMISLRSNLFEKNVLR